MGGGGHKEDADPAERSLSEKTAGEDGGEGGRHTASSSRDAGKTKTERKCSFYHKFAD